MSETWVTLDNGSIVYHDTYEWDIFHIWMNYESYYTHEWDIYYTYEWDIWHIWVRRLSHMDELRTTSFTHGWNTSCYTHEWDIYCSYESDIWHIRVSRLSHMDELRIITLENCPVALDSRWHIYLLHNILHITRMSESSFDYGWITSRITHI